MQCCLNKNPLRERKLAVFGVNLSWDSLFFAGAGDLHTELSYKPNFLSDSELKHLVLKVRIVTPNLALLPTFDLRTFEARRL